MYCSSCGAQSDASTCLVCGQDLSTRSNGVVDPLTGEMLAGWWRRVAATISDTLILLLPTLAVGALFQRAGELWLGVEIALVLRGIYEVALLATEGGQTVGNRVASTRVRDARTGQRLGVSQAFWRYCFIAAYNVVGLLGRPGFEIALLIAAADWLCPLVDRRHQTLHDKFARSIVVNL